MVNKVTCVLCGGEVGRNFTADSELPPWMHHFRAIYAHGMSSAEVCLSGIGRKLPGAYEIPDPSLSGEREDQVNYSIINLMLTQFRDYNIPGYPRGSDPWGFPFHCSCWELFKASSPTKDVDLQALFDLCRSFPVTLSGTIDFGHDYGGLYGRHPDDDIHPILCNERSDRYCEAFAIDSEAVNAHQYGPPDASFLDPVFDKPASTNECFAPLKLIHITADTQDVFTKLPLEILQDIITCLRSPDVLNLKLSSRVFANVPLPDRFWHSRFGHGHEFACLIELEQHSQYKGQWRNIFLSVRRQWDHPILVNRKRVWGLAKVLRGLLSRTAGICHGSRLHSWFESDAPSDQMTWVSASRCIYPYDTSFASGSRPLYTRLLVLPEKLSSISISTVEMLTGRYISGIQIQDTNSSYWDLGYVRPYGSSLVTVPSTRISGFLIAGDQLGMRGLAVFDENGIASKWVGEYEGISQRRLVLPKSEQQAADPVQYIKGEFDACKMVSLSVAGHVSPANDVQENHYLLDGQNCNLLRDKGFWYPHIPPSGYNLFGGVVRSMKDGWYKWPLQMINFGGPSGDHLPHVTCVKVWESIDHYHVLSVSVELDEPLDGQTEVYLGRNQDTLDQLRRHDDSLVAHRFEINSAAGERIIGIDVYYDNSQLPFSFKVHTSFNRSAELPEYNAPDNPRTDTEYLWPENGHIVGFYGLPDGSVGIYNLGIVCVGTTTLKEFEIEISSSEE